MKKHESAQTRDLMTDKWKAAFGPKIRITKIPGGTFLAGFPDLDICFKGMSILAEVKMWDNAKPYPTPMQKEFLRKNAEARGLGLFFLIQKDRTILCDSIVPPDQLHFEDRWVLDDLLQAIGAKLVALNWGSATAGSAGPAVRSKGKRPKFIKPKPRR